MSGYIYFVQGDGPIKIGYSANPVSRFAALKSASPEPLDLVATIPGTRKFERDLHDMFAADRLRGEWFADSPALCSLIEAFISPDLDNPDHSEIHRCIGVIEEQRRLKRELEEISS